MNTRAKFRKRIEFSKVGLVCSGGATKAAAFHIGVCLALRDKGFSFIGGRLDHPTPVNALAYPRVKYHPHQIATYVGSSAGALMVTMLAAGISIESIINSFTEDPQFKIPGSYPEIPRISYRDMLSINWPKPSHIARSFRKSSIFSRSLESLFLKNLRLPGIFSTRGLAEYLRKNILVTDRFHELKPELFVVGTQLDHSRKIIFGRFGTEKEFDLYAQYASNVPISDAVAASMTLPPIFAPYLIHHDEKQRYYIDGEIRETLSSHVAKENGCDLILCSYTHQPYHFKEEIGSLYEYGVAAIVIQALYQAIEQKVYGARKAHDQKVATIATVREFFRERRLPEADLKDLIEHLEEKLEFKEKMNYLYIHPEPKDREMFFGDHFTLNPQTLQNVVTIGYKRAMSELRKYEFVPRPMV